ILDLGCGLGLTGMIAALKGGRVTFADREPAALTFATVSAQMNNCSHFEARLLDFTQNFLDQRFDLILGAEILYDRPAFPALIAFLDHHIQRDGSALLADAKRTNTEEFYRQLDQIGFKWEQVEIQEREENVPLKVGIVTVSGRRAG